jgi:hypothetical protein
MSIHTKPPAPYLTRQGLRHISQEVNAARREMLDILRIGGDIRAIWHQPRKYLESENGTQFPVPNEELRRLLKPIWNEHDLADPTRRALLSDIWAHSLFFDLARREMIPERFTRM